MAQPRTLERKPIKVSGQLKGLRRVGAYESGRFYTHRLSLLNRLIARTTKQMLADEFGLSQMEWRVLIQLEQRSPAKIADMHERSLVPKPQLSSVLPGLIRKGLVVRENDAADARAPNFALTDEGLKLYRAVMRVSRKRQRKLEFILSQHERVAFDAAIDHLIAFFAGEVGRDGGLFDDAPDAIRPPAASVRAGGARQTQQEHT
jgi:DNA-binding MarR family transcriptional regulator